MSIRRQAGHKRPSQLKAAQYVPPSRVRIKPYSESERGPRTYLVCSGVYYSDSGDTYRLAN